MKKTLTALAAATALIAQDIIYPTAMVVTSAQDGIALLETSTGHCYEMDAEDYEVGDVVALIMYSNGTEDIRDDVILAHRYTGF